MALSADNDDNTSSIDPVGGLVDKNWDPATRAAAKRQSLTGHIGMRFHDKKNRRDLIAALMNSAMNLDPWGSPYQLQTIRIAEPPPKPDCEAQVWGPCHTLNKNLSKDRGELIPVATATGGVIFLCKEMFELTHDNDGLELDPEELAYDEAS